MSIVQWLLLILVIVIVVGAYLFIRRAGGSDPWHDMDDSGSSGGESSGGGSYVVGVRTINKETPADRKAAQVRKEADEPPKQPRAVRKPTAVRRRRAEPEIRVTDDEMEEVEKEPAAPAAGSRQPVVEPEPEPDTEIPSSATERVEMVAPQRGEHSQVFMLYVKAREDELFQGPAIQKALQRVDLKFGLNDLYHRVTEVHGVTESVFCVSNMIQPGTLDPVDQDHLYTPGLAFFLLVPAPIESRAAMRDMMETANKLANELGGQVLDDNRSLLKTQTAQYMFDQVADIERRAKLAQRRR